MFFCLLLGHREFNIVRPKKGHNLFSKSRVMTQIFQESMLKGKLVVEGAGMSI